MRKALDKTMWVIENLVAGLIAVTVVFIAAQILFRYVLGHPLSWTEQLSRYIFIWVCLLGAPMTIYKKMAYSFDVLARKLPEKIQPIVALGINACNILFCCYWGYWVIQLIQKMGWRMTSGVEVKMGYLYAAQIVCALLMIFNIVVDSVEIIQGMRKKGDA